MAADASLVLFKVPDFLVVVVVMVVAEAVVVVVVVSVRDTTEGNLDAGRSRMLRGNMGTAGLRDDTRTRSSTSSAWDRCER